MKHNTLRLCASLVISTLFALLLLPVQDAFGQTSVLTQNNDNARTAANLTETTLTLANVNVKTFGKLFTRTLDDNVNGQVLYAPNIVINGTTHNVIYAYTSNNYSNNSLCSLYAFDADDPNASAPLWHHAFTNSAEDTTCTPSLDPSTNTVYVLTKDNDDNGDTNLRALDMTTGNEKPGSPVLLAASVPGTGDGNSGGVVSFDTTHADCRPGLLLLNGIVYAAFAHNSDSFPYHGWILGYKYDGTKFTQAAAFCVDPNGGEAGIWQGGKGLAADSQGHIYCATGNGTFDADQGGADYGMCYLQLTPTSSLPGLMVTDWFAPHDELHQSNGDLDLCNSGLLGIPGTNRLFGGGTKFGSVFLLDSTNLGHYLQGANKTDNVVQRFDNVVPLDSIGQNAVVWDAGTVKYVYLWAHGANLQQYLYDPTVGKFNPAGIYKQTSGNTQGAGLGISANGSQNGILWAVDGNSVFHALDASDVTKELWNDKMNASRDKLQSTGHFQFPTIVNGKVYVGTRSATITAYGLLPLVSSADAYVQDGSSANTNFGASSVLRVHTDSQLNSGSNQDAYLKFDTSPYNAITRARLRVYAALDTPGAVTINAYAVSSAWTESGLTWNNRTALLGNHGRLTVSGTTYAFYDMDLTSYVQSERAKGHATITLALHNPSVTAQTLLLNSKEAGANPPQLIVNNN